MSEYPSVVKLGQKPSNKDLHEREVVNCLSQYDEVVHFIKKLVAYVDAVHHDNYQRHDVANDGKPSFHKLWMSVFCC